MNLDISKETILQQKLNLLKVMKSKKDAVVAKDWERAAWCRDEEKQIRENLTLLKNEILRALQHIKTGSENIEDYVLLQGLLFEFYATEFEEDCSAVKAIEAIESHARTYWNLRDQMHQDWVCFLNEEYSFLREQMHLAINEGDRDKSQIIVSKLTAIADLIEKTRK